MCPPTAPERRKNRHNMRVSFLLALLRLQPGLALGAFQLIRVCYRELWFLARDRVRACVAWRSILATPLYDWNFHYVWRHFGAALGLDVYHTPQAFACLALVRLYLPTLDKLIQLTMVGRI
jgi:hypothetical protein